MRLNPFRRTGRPTFERARIDYPHRFTLEHMPVHAYSPLPSGRYPAPQYRSDREWYENTRFPGERGLHGNRRHAMSSNPTWPRGVTLDRPYRRLNHD